MNSKKGIMDTKTMVKAGLLTALSIVLTRFMYIFVPLGGAQTLRISFGEVPVMMSGLLFGPVVGGITGAAADLIGVLVNSQGAFHPGFTLSSILWGVIPGLLYLIFRRAGTYEKVYSFKNILIAVGAAYIVVSLMLNTIWLQQLYSTGVLALLPGRIINTVVSIPLQSILITTLFKYLKILFKS